MFNVTREDLPKQAASRTDTYHAPHRHGRIQTIGLCNLQKPLNPAVTSGSTPLIHLPLVLD
jgi:hypothetical protein